MRAVLLTLCALTALAMLAIALANLSGELRLRLGGYEAYIPLALVVSAALVLWLVTLGVIAMGVALLGWRGRVSRRRQAARQHEGDTALANALMALAQGRMGDANQAALIARQKLPNKPLPLLMAAQVALLDNRGDDAAAHLHHLADPASDLLSDSGAKEVSQRLGLEGLFYLAQRRGDYAQAGEIALKMLAAQPATLWALDGLMAMAIDIGDWSAAQNWFKQWSRKRGQNGITRAALKYRHAVLLTGAAQAALQSDDAAGLTAARQKAEQAVDLVSDFVPAICLAARLQTALGDGRKARSLLKRAYAHLPHAELATAWLDCVTEQPAATRQRAAAAFVRPHFEHIESHILRAQLAIKVKRWHTARAYLRPYIGKRRVPPARLCRLMAEIETGTGDLAAASKWQEKAIHAPIDVGWATGGPHATFLADWQPVCPITGQIGAVIWRIVADEADDDSLPVASEVSEASEHVPQIAPPSAGGTQIDE